MGVTSAEEAAEEGQEELRSMLEAWQSMLDHIASPHQDISAAPGELASLHAAAKRHMDVLSEHAATIDSAASSKVSTRPTPIAEPLGDAHHCMHFHRSMAMLLQRPVPLP
jgi:hypothetical protein